MATLATEQVTAAGLTFTKNAAAGGGDAFTPGDTTFLIFENGSGGEITATVVTPKEHAGLAIADLAVVVAAGTQVIAGPFPTPTYADPADGLADITYSGVTSFTVGVIKH